MIRKMRPTIASAVIGAVIATSLAACVQKKSAAKAKDALDATSDNQGSLSANDLSIILPLDGSNIAGLISSTDTGAKGKLLPDFVWTAIQTSLALPLGFPASPDNSSTDPVHTRILVTDPGSTGGTSVPNTLYVTSMRFDHCAPTFTDDDAKCLRQLRLIWQTQDGGDAAVHTIYNLTKDEFQEAILALNALRKGSNLNYADKPLGPQPILVQQGLKGDYAQKITAMVKKYAGSANLNQVAFFSNLAGFGPWRFGSFNISGDKATPSQVVNSHGHEKFDIVGFYDARGASATAPYPSLNPLMAANGINSNNPGFFGVAYEPLTPETQAGYDGLLDILNPLKNSVTTLDCGSCHLAGMQARAFDSTIGDQKNRFAGLDRTSRRYPAGDSAYEDDKLFGGNLHNISYFVGHLHVAQRTVNETDMVVKWVNKNMLKP